MNLMTQISNIFFGDEQESNPAKPLRELDEKQLPFVGWTYRRFEKKANKPRADSLFPEEEKSKSEKKKKPKALQKSW